MGFQSIDLVIYERECIVDVAGCFQKGRMEKTIETVRQNFNSVRTGRANPAMLDKIEVLNLLAGFITSVAKMFSKSTFEIYPASIQIPHRKIHGY